jgi:hypothetical protein
MFDTSAYLSGEVRALAFRKEDEHPHWQDAVKQKRANEMESQLDKIIQRHWLATLFILLLHPLNWLKHSSHVSHI